MENGELKMENGECSLSIFNFQLKKDENMD